MSSNVSKRKHDDAAERRAHNLSVAHKAAAAGLYVFAVDGASKRPLTRGWQSIEPADIEEAERLHWASVRASNEAARKRGEREYEPDFVAYGSTCNADRIKQIWAALPDAMPAISLGPSRLGVVDGDNKATFHVQLDGETKLRTVTRKGSRYSIMVDGVERRCMSDDDDLVFHDEARKLRRFNADALRLLKKNGAERVAEMLAAEDLRHWPLTRTQSGGYHLIFSNDSPDPIQKGIGFAGYSVDILGEGRQILAPGAWRIDGARYIGDEKHVDFYETYEVGLILPPPPSVISFGGLLTQSQAAERLRSKLSSQSTVAPEGFEVDTPDAEARLRGYLAHSRSSDKRHDALQVIVGRAGDFGLSCERTTEILLELNGDGEIFNGDALDEGDIASFVQRHYDVRQKPIGCDFKRNREPSDGRAFGAVEGEDDEDDEPAAKGDKPLFVFAHDAAAAWQPPEYLIDGWLPRNSFGFLFGASKALKSFGAIDMASHLANGMAWRGVDSEHVGVLYWAGEGQENIAGRFAGWAKTYGVEKNHVGLCDMPLNAASPRDFKRTIKKLISAYDAAAPRRCEVMFLDIWNKCVRLERGDEFELSPIIKAMEDIARELRITIVAVGHTGKNQALGMRGSNVYETDAAFRIFVERGKGLVTKFSVEKQKDGPDKTSLTMTAELVEVGTNQRGKAVTTLAFRPEKKAAAMPAADDEDAADLGERPIGVEFTPEPSTPLDEQESRMKSALEKLAKHCTSDEATKTYNGEARTKISTATALRILRRLRDKDVADLTAGANKLKRWFLLAFDYPPELDEGEP